MAFLILFVIGVSLGSHAVLSQSIRVSTAFKNAAIVPDIIPEAPTDILDVYYPSVGVCLGNEIPHTHAVLKPRLEYDFKPRVNYTVLFINPDVTSAAAPVLRQTTHWIVVNIPGGKLEAGYTIADYIPVIFYSRTGYRRYIILLYAQKRAIDVSNRDILRWGVNRYLISIPDFAKKMV